MPVMSIVVPPIPITPQPPGLPPYAAIPTLPANPGLPAEIPPELDRWNWGAFLLHWIWGIGNGVFIALLAFVPVVGILVMPFVLGARGNAWAWRSRRWTSVEQFRRVQRLWAIWGVVVWLGLIVLIAGIVAVVVFSLKGSDAYRLGVERLRASPQAVEVLGTPIEAGVPMGSISKSDGSGEAALTFSATGPKASGSVALTATRSAGTWTLTNLRLKVDGRDEVVDLLRERRASDERRRLADRSPSGRGLRFP